MTSKSSAKIINIVKWGLILLPALALIVAGNFYANILLPGVGDLFFPFITGKNFFFRILVEILFALWAWAAIFDKNARPASSPLLIAVFATLGALTLATIFGENPYRSFWSNYERMEGLVGMLHLLAYFVILTGVFKKMDDWKKLFYSMLSVSFLVSTYAYFQLAGIIRIYQSGNRLDATLGNSTYLAIYIVFHLFILLYLFLTDGSAKHVSGQKKYRTWVSYLSAILFLYELPIVFFTATRGAIMGLLGGFFLFGLLYGILNKRKSARIVAVSLIVLTVLLVGSFLLLKDANFVRNNYVLQRFVGLSFKEQTVTSRLTIWKMSIEGFKENPILGWGPENYNLVFNKYYKPQLWNQEPWFDRSHNVIFDWLISGGILGLLAYLSIFAAALYMLWFGKKDQKEGWNPTIPITFTSLFAVYVFHNLFVFDNLTSYFMFFSVLAFLHFVYAGQRTDAPAAHKINSSPVQYLGVAGVFVLVFASLYIVNIKPLLASRDLISALKEMSTNGGDTDAVIAKFDKVFAHNSFGSGEGREQLSMYANQVAQSDLSNDKKSKVLAYSIKELEKQVAEGPKDARNYMFLAALYENTGRKDEAVNTVEAALEVAPNKQQLMFVAGDIYLNAGQPQKAIEILKKAYELDPTYDVAATSLAIYYVATGNSKEGEAVLEKTFGKPIVADTRLLNAYGRIGNYQRVRDIWLLFIEQEPNNSQYRVNLAATYLNLGDRLNAIKSIEEAIKLNPSFKEQGEQYIKDIRAGKNP
ncbi:O-antigen ligase family protein [Candidatus Giovannonibacteria bacterium]|nr:O-antigen ligase family protein [Candidatus Giovannonibacteria bacterium]